MKKRQQDNKKLMVCVLALVLIAILPVYALAITGEVSSNVEISAENMLKFAKRSAPTINESSTEEKEDEVKIEVIKEVMRVDTYEELKDTSVQVKKDELKDIEPVDTFEEVKESSVQVKKDEPKNIKPKESENEQVVIEDKIETTILQEEVMTEAENIKEESKIFIGNDGVSYKSVKTMDFYATAYCHCKKCCGKEPGHQAYGITASGLNLIDLLEQGIKPRIVAADTRVLPFGTKIYVEVPESERTIYVQDDYGFASVEDIGSAIKNMKIDVYFPTDVEACEWGVKNVIVHVLEPVE